MRTAPWPPADSDPLVQEALSVKHDACGVMVQPLTSGRFAVYDMTFRLIAIVDEPDKIPQAIAISRANGEARRLAEREALARAYAARPPAAAPSLSADELATLNSLEFDL